MPEGRDLENAIITDVVDTLLQPEEYVRGVLQSMYEYERENGPSVVRIGVLGRGRQPNYCLEPITSVNHGERIDGQQNATHFQGSTHRRVSDFGEENWSQEYMTLQEVSTLLGTIRRSR